MSRSRKSLAFPLPECCDFPDTPTGRPFRSDLRPDAENPRHHMARWMQTALTKPRFSFLHLVLFALSLSVALALLGHWSAFKAGFRDGWSGLQAP